MRAAPDRRHCRLERLVGLMKLASATTLAPVDAVLL